MEDIIDIIVTETTNLIEITSQPTDEIIDVNIIDNREDITLNVTPSVVEININSLTGNFGVNWGEIGGTLSSQTDLNTALGLKADLVDGKVPSSQLPSYVDDVVEGATYSALPVIGEVGKIYVVLDTNFIYRWSGSAYIEIKDSSAVWGAITGTLSSQTDLQTALNAKFDDPTGDTTQYIAGDGSLITFPIAGQAGTLVREVRNTTGATLTKGTIVYISGATGNKPTVSKALATGDSTSAQTFGLCQADIANNANGYVVCTGDIVGLDTSAISEGVQLYLSSTTAGTYTTTKQFAPAHLVYIGVVTRSHPTQGQIEVKIQNGYELEELHNVSAQTPSNNDGLFYESSTSLWKNKSIATVLGYTPQAQLNGTGFVKASGTTISYDNSTYLTTSAATSTYLALGGGTMTGVLFGASASFSGYVGFGGNTSPLAPIDVTGAAIISGQLKLGSTITNGTYTYTLPSATGTLALASSLSSYVPYTGATQGVNIGTNMYTGGYAVLNGSGTNQAGVLSLFKGTSRAVQGNGYTNLYAEDGKVGFNDWITGNVRTFEFSLASITAGVTRVYTLPDASGTIALTSNLSSYLPLSGGTLTGALSGTSATFSANASATYFTATAGQGYNGNLNFNYNNANTSSFGYWGGGTNTVFLVTSTGAATFSSSVTAGTLSINTTTYNGAFAVIRGNNSAPATSGTTTTATLRLTSGTGLYNVLDFGTNESSDYAWIQSTRANSLGTYDKLLLNPNGGNVGIGTTNAASRFNIKGDSSNSQLEFNNFSTGENYILSYDRVASAYKGLIITTNAANNALVVTSSGNVGIGTTSPFSTNGTNLEIASSTSSASRLILTNSSASGHQYFLQNQGDGNLIIYDNTAASERMRITSGGNVGIGTAIPQGGGGSTDRTLSINSGAGAASFVTGLVGDVKYSTLFTASSIVVLETNAAIPLAFNTNSTERMRITSGGAVLVNQTSQVLSSSRFEITQTTNNHLSYWFVSSGTGNALLFQRIDNTANYYSYFTYGTTNVGSITTNGSATSYNITSDYRLKEDLKPIKGLDIVNKIKVYDYKWKSEDSRMDGVMAHELAEVLPYAVTGVKDGEQMQQVDYSKIVPVMVQAIKELKAELDTLKNK